MSSSKIQFAICHTANVSFHWFKLSSTDEVKCTSAERLWGKSQQSPGEIVFLSIKSFHFLCYKQNHISWGRKLLAFQFLWFKKKIVTSNCWLTKWWIFNILQNNSSWRNRMFTFSSSKHTLSEQSQWFPYAKNCQCIYRLDEWTPEI